MMHGTRSNYQNLSVRRVVLPAILLAGLATASIPL